MSKNRNRSASKPLSKSALLDVCVLSAGRFDLLGKCLDSIYREAQTTPLNILILDNGSDIKERNDNISLLNYQPDKDPGHGVVRFQVKRLDQNVGFPLGSNAAAKMGVAPIIMHISDDIELLPGSIENVLEDFRDQSVGIVGIKLMFPPTSTDRNRPAGKTQHVGMAIDIHGSPIHPLVGWSADNPKCSVSRDVWAVTGACFTIRRNLFHKLGGFDPIYGIGTHEDLDLCMKVRQSGQRVYFDARAQGYHYVGATAEKRRESFPLQQNRSIFMARWQNSGQVFWNEVEWW